MDFNDYLDANYDVEFVSGGNQIKLSGQCPFCGEDRSDLRLYVNAESGKGQCFHCGEGFGPISFVMAAEGCEFPQAKKILSDDEDDYVREKQQAQAPEVKFPFMEQITAFPGAMKYMNDRGIDARLIDYFKMTYCRQNLVMGDRTLYTKSRVIIPIHDILGRLVSWTGRDTTGRSKTKYLMPPGFQSADHLYHAWGIPNGPQYLIIVEGVFDVYGWWRAGITNVVATFGKKISEAQIKIIDSIMPERVFIAWDSDANWMKYEFIQKYGHHWPVRMIDLSGKDSDELSQGALIKALGTAKGFSWSDKILSSV